MTLADSDESLSRRLREAREELRCLQTEAADIAGGVGRVARDEVRLAVSEVRDGIRATVRAGIWVAVATGFAVVALLWLPLPIFIALNEAMTPLAAALVTFALLALSAAIVGFYAWRRVKRVSVAPRAAAQRMKEDKEWLIRQFSEERN